MFDFPVPCGLPVGISSIGETPSVAKMLSSTAVANAPVSLSDSACCGLGGTRTRSARLRGQMGSLSAVLWYREVIEFIMFRASLSNGRPGIAQLLTMPDPNQRLAA